MVCGELGAEGARGSLGGYRLRNYDICQSCTRDHYSPRTHFHRPCIVRTDKAVLSWMAWPNHKLHCLACCNNCGHDSDYRSRRSCTGNKTWKSVVKGKSVDERVDFGGCRL